MTEEVKKAAWLKPHHFKPGNDGFGGGANKKGLVTLRTILKKVLDYELDLENPVTTEKYKMSVNEAIALKLVKRALDGNLKAIEMVFDRVDGKVADMLQLGNIDDKPLELASSLKYDFSKLSVDELLFVRNVLQKTSNTENN